VPFACQNKQVTAVIEGPPQTRRKVSGLGNAQISLSAKRPP
jgi:hypothetical protein